MKKIRNYGSSLTLCLYLFNVYILSSESINFLLRSAMKIEDSIGK